MSVIVKLTEADIHDALKAYAKQKLDGCRLIATDVIISIERGNAVCAEVTFTQHSTSSYYDR